MMVLLSFPVVLVKVLLVAQSECHMSLLKMYKVKCQEKKAEVGFGQDGNRMERLLSSQSLANPVSPVAPSTRICACLSTHWLSRLAHILRLFPDLHTI